MTSSGNAFKDGAHAHLLATPAPANRDTGHERKRRKLAPSPPLQARIYTKTADVSIDLEVDHMILDYLSHQATDDVLASRRSGKAHATLQHKLVMMDSFLEMFKAKHPSYRPDPELRFRLLLLKFSTLFCHRFVRSAILPSNHMLHQLKEQNTLRALDWIRDSNRLPSGDRDMSRWETRLPFAPQTLEYHRARSLEAVKLQPEGDKHGDAFYGTPASLALLDILPLFMSVIAARNELANSNLSLGLMDLAARFMLQACLEQYLIFGVDGTDAIDEAFAWGYKRPHAATESEDQVDSINSQGAEEVSDETIRMFQAEDGVQEENPDWEDLKAKYIALLADETPGALQGHLEQIAKDQPVAKFENTVLQLLAGLAASLSPPVLAQLERGSLDGMGPKETKAFLRSCGLGSEWPKKFG
jgi:hypothetical protein